MNFAEEEKTKTIFASEYAVSPDVFERSAWGYNTVTYYAQSRNVKYIVKATPFTDTKYARCRKDVFISSMLSGVLPTPLYVKNVHGEYITLSSNLIVRVAQYVEGTAPFEMDTEIYRQILRCLETIHDFSLEACPESKNLGLRVLEDGKVFLHGDLTPSNVIVADGKVVEVLDFEDCLLGPVEHDLARSAVFCWYRMKTTTFKEIFEYTLGNYQGAANRDKFFRYCVSHAENHLNQVVTNRDKYDDKVFWSDNFKFSSQAVKEIKSLKL